MKSSQTGIQLAQAGQFRQLARRLTVPGFVSARGHACVREPWTSHDAVPQYSIESPRSALQLTVPHQNLVSLSLRRWLSCALGSSDMISYTRRQLCVSTTIAVASRAVTAAELAVTVAPTMMSEMLQQRTILVVGASGRTGREVVRLLQEKEGSRQVIAGVRSEKVAQMLKLAGIDVLVTDLTEEGMISNLVTELKARNVTDHLKRR
eukprot:gnl/MRDRNA2_/MRDRNA2_52155_c0_seq2.p1 gnl/MRDRNA2_/MRDRNA2_52155_c0~~gnl/MRDRNA2_/MRDRNA2_52155_c0_seq2.p1  ORF type:complete len:230 (-),score=33.85 gnl/MRDRNA2_/MRDRNA2_52155_c0_seq2:347-967(-)